MAGKESSDMGILSHSQHNYREPSAAGLEFLCILCAAGIGEAGVGDEGMELCLCNRPAGQQGGKELPLESAKITLLIVERYQPFIGHEKLNPPEQIGRLGGRLRLHCRQQSNHAASTAQAHHQRRPCRLLPANSKYVAGDFCEHNSERLGLIA
jgi:hypothetical protein